MKTIVTLSQKGGAGKTALTLNLAVAAQKAGFKVGVIDVDPQQSSAEWGDQRAEVTDEGPSVIGGHAKGLPKLLATASDGGADFVFIDSPPGKNDAHLEMARLADLILVPCRPSVVDIRAITATAEIGTLAGKQVWVVFNAAPPTSPYLVEQAREALKTWEIESVPHVIHHRIAFVTSFAQGRGAIEEDPNGKAADEIRDLFDWVRDQTGLPTGKTARRKTGQTVNRTAGV